MGNVNFVARPDLNGRASWRNSRGDPPWRKRLNLEKCAEIQPGCKEVHRMVKDVLFSWWTDVPWVNLAIVGDLMQHLYGERKTDEITWAQMSSRIVWVRFEMIGYEFSPGFKRSGADYDREIITDNVNFVARSDRNTRLNLEKCAEIQPGCKAVPPLIIFHADKGRPRSDRDKYRELWKTVMSQIMHKKGSTLWIGDL